MSGAALSTNTCSQSISIRERLCPIARPPPPPMACDRGGGERLGVAFGGLCEGRKLEPRWGKKMEVAAR
jgi:hypothetical protein